MRNIMVVLLLIWALFLIRNYTFYAGIERGEMVEELAAVAEQVRITNVVTLVYLGPRIFDTFLEVIVVVLTVFGIKSLRSHL